MTEDNLSSLSEQQFLLQQGEEELAVSSNLWGLGCAGIWQEIPGNFLYLNVRGNVLQPT